MRDIELYLGLVKIRSILGNYVIVNVKSNLPEDYPARIQMYLNAGVDPDCAFHDPDFPWSSAGVALVYIGLKEEADEWSFLLPDGRLARAWNINYGCKNEMAKAFEGYACAMDLARTALLAGATPEEAAQKLWAYSEEHDVAPTLTSHQEKFSKVVDEMEEYRMILLEDVRELEEKKGTIEELQ